jgi:hypothetical protein
MMVVDVPLYEPEVAGGTPVKGTWTPAVLPTGAAAWMWAAVAAADRPEKLSVQVDVEVDWSNVNEMLPVPWLALGGTSLDPARAAVHWIRLLTAWTG